MSENKEQNQDTIVLAKPPTPEWFYLTLSALIFPFGFLLGYLYLQKTGMKNKKFGMKTLIYAAVLPALLVIVFIVSFIAL
ncbi:hypothetical protein ACFL2D_00610 [Patescibacteria group bacterium]